MPTEQNVIYNKSKNNRLWALKDGKFSLACAVAALLLQEDRLTTYRIKKKLEEIGKTKIPYSTLHGVINDMAKTGHVKIVEKKPFRTKLEKKLYSITAMGFKELIFSVRFPNPALEPSYVVKYILKRQDLSPFLHKAHEWNMIETPNLLLALFTYHGAVFDNHLRGYSSKEQVTSSFERMLLGLTFFDYFKKREGAEYHEAEEAQLVATPEVKKEAELFIENNLWIKAKMLKHLEGIVEWAQSNLSSAKEALEYCKPFLV